MSDGKPNVARDKKNEKKKQRKTKLTARNADKYVLYQISVQEPSVEVEFIHKTFKKLTKRKPMTLREDFCGTALMCAEWIKSNKERTATGVDLDPEPLQWGTEHHFAELGEPGKRVTLLQQDVLEPVSGEFDTACAFNFSYWIFRTRDVMRSYFENVRRTLKEDGVFFLDAYGGYEAQIPETLDKKYKPGFTYIWEQRSFDPITHEVQNYIHFKFKDGTKLKKAFSYSWRYWSLPELKELLLEAGFSDVTVYWEGDDGEGEGNGIYKPKKAASNDPAWICYIVARA